MNKNRLYVDFHVLQTVPPSCVNRDDTGSPKTAIYGGAMRARVSSQAWKHAMRVMFCDSLLDKEDNGLRTKRIVDLIAKQLMTLDPSIRAEDASKKAVKAVEYAGLKLGKDGKAVDALFFISRAQIMALAELIVKGNDDKKEYKEALKAAPSADMALFGRMVASDPSLNYDAAAQIAHSISTHAVQNEYDYFTAVDDCAPDDNAGAGHLGTVEYNSATLYRYATVNAVELAGSLDASHCAEIIRAFAEAFICSMPTGKQNTFANRTLPDAVYVTVRTDQPVNLCGAYERPIVKSVSGYVEPSKSALVHYAQQVYGEYTNAPEHAFVIGSGLDDLGKAMPMKDLLDQLQTTIEEYLARYEVK